MVLYYCVWDNHVFKSKEVWQKPIPTYIFPLVLKKITPQPEMFQNFIATKTFLPFDDLFKGQGCKSLPENNHFT